ncbi:hypothetical protein E5A74_18815 [Sphingomonas naasensis]|uniref:Uncharacterized protein n=1 Tax=Sphingomonas naasensis TaxID=1344951 RepID=A0A4S1W7G8_9SPHN|nr:hypothetical protein E5A74_18815 [Sphingomonas naasensis]
MLSAFLDSDRAFSKERTK